MAGIFGVSETISLADFLVISIIGGVLSSIVVLALTLGVASLSVRRGWDMDNVAAPLVTAAGDMVTLPSLFLATYLVGIKGVTVTIAVLAGAVAVGSLVWAMRLKLPIVSRILRESVPVLLVAGVVDLVAGLTIEHQLESFLAYPALLVLVPPFLEDTGALGSVLSSRLASKLHLGIIEPTARPQRAARDDFAIVALLAIPVFTLVAISSQIAAAVFGLASPGVLNMIGISLIGGAIATFFAAVHRLLRQHRHLPARPRPRQLRRAAADVVDGPRRRHGPDRRHPRPRHPLTAADRVGRQTKMRSVGPVGLVGRVGRAAARPRRPGT